MFRSAWALCVLIISTVALGVPAALGATVSSNGDLVMRFARLWGRVNLWAVGARVRYSGLDEIPAGQSCVFAANHQSYADIWVLARVVPVQTRFVAKQSLFRIPALGWAMSAAGFIPIDRQSRTRALRGLERAAARLRDGVSVIVFPEGTRSLDGTLAAFKKGPFHLALRAGVPVVPVAIRGSGKVTPPHSLRRRPGPIEVRFLPAIAVDPYLPRDLDGVRRDVRDRIAQALSRD